MYGYWVLLEYDWRRMKYDIKANMKQSLSPRYWFSVLKNLWVDTTKGTQIATLIITVFLCGLRFSTLVPTTSFVYVGLDYFYSPVIIMALMLKDLGGLAVVVTAYVFTILYTFIMALIVSRSARVVIGYYVLNERAESTKEGKDEE